MAQRSELGEVVSRVNRVHCRLAPVGRFITLAVVLLEPDGTLALVNAGHCPALHVSRDGVRALTTAGIALGLDADFEYRAVSVPLQPGDTLVLFTDGVVECEGADRALFGDERLARAVAASRGAPPAQVLAQLVREVDRFRGNTPVSDDLSVLVVRRA
jgi:sigma-B regulation protein RsbU (phosphoserine phosphatase)